MPVALGELRSEREGIDMDLMLTGPASGLKPSPIHVRSIGEPSADWNRRSSHSYAEPSCRPTF